MAKRGLEPTSDTSGVISGTMADHVFIGRYVSVEGKSISFPLICVN